VKAILYARSVTITAAIMGILLMTSVSAAVPTLFKQTAIATVDQGDATANTTTTTSATATDNATRRVAVGGGNITFSVNQFSPQITQIQPGESITFFAPNGSLELHNVMFDLTNGTTISDIGVPFILPSDTLGGEVPTDVSQELLPAPPYNLGEPIIQNMADGTQAIVGFNKIAFYPAVVDQDGNVMYPEEEEIIQQMRQINQGFEGGPMPPPISTSYTMDGTERVVSSGIVLDVNGFSALEALFAEEGGEEGASQQEVPAATEDNQGSMTNSTMTTTTPQIPTDEETMAQQEEEPAQEPQFPFLGSFTVTFEAPGTYDYFCAFHPGMFGQVVVGEG
jgi:plastocyanin